MRPGSVEPTVIVASSPRNSMMKPNERRCRVDVSQPTVNLKTAKALGLTVPDSLLARADEVIE